MIKTAGKGIHPMVFKSIKTRIYTYVAAWIVILSAAHLAIHIFGPDSEDWRPFVIETMAAIIPLIFFARYFYTHTVRPVEDLSGILKNATLGIQPEQLISNHKDEIGLLTREFNTMIHALHHRDELLKRMNERLKAQNRELLSVNERLSEANSVRTQFLATVTHELKTPLSTITGYSEMMLDGVGGELNSTQKDFVEEIAGSTSHLLLLVNDVLDFSKAAGGTMDMSFEEFDLSKLINDIEVNVYPLLRKKEQTFDISLAPDLNNLVADRLRIKQVLLNLLSNAIKFTPKGGKVSVKSIKSERYWGIVVADNGIGIKEEDFYKIFEPFSQVDSSHTRKFEGTGLGLAICSRIIGMHGGRIWVESEPGKGSSFYFTIPDKLHVDTDTGKNI